VIHQHSLDGVTSRRREVELYECLLVTSTVEIGEVLRSLLCATVSCWNDAMHITISHGNKKLSCHNDTAQW